MDGTLGVAEHDVVLTYRGGRLPLGQFPRASVSSLRYGRVVDDISTCDVEVALDARCCGLAGEVRSWGHEIHVLRDGVEVWCGPVVIADVGRDNAKFTAWDVLGWLKVRAIEHRLDYTGANRADLSTIVQAIIVDVLTPDDPNLLPYLTVTASAIEGERLMLRGRSMAWDDVAELSRTGVDVTAVGRRIVVSGEAISTAPLATLTSEHFLDELRVVERGDVAATRWRVNGSGLTVLVGGVDAFYGLIDGLVDEPAIRDATSATNAAQNRLDVTYPAPLYVQVPEGARLSPKAPLPFDNLVPGALCNVHVTDLCRTVAQTMRLQSVEVSSDGNDTDRVAVTLAPVGATEGVVAVEGGA